MKVNAKEHSPPSGRRDRKPTLRVLKERSAQDRRGSERARSGGRRRNEPGAHTVTPAQFKIIEETFATLAPSGPVLVERFYQTLFKRHPEVRDLFAHVTPKTQHRMLLEALKFVVDNIREPAVLNPVLTELGSRHRRYGAEPEHFPVVTETLLGVMKELTGSLWTAKVEKAWTNTFDFVNNAMLKSYRTEESVKMATNKQRVARDFASSEFHLTEDLKMLTNILEHAPINIMMADSDENIVFVNQQAGETLSELEPELSKFIPGFRADRILGGSIHQFHSDPYEIRMALKRLSPEECLKGEINLGSRVFDYEIRRMLDDAKQLAGYVMQWQDVTEQRQKDERAQRLQTAVDGAQTAIMTIDRDLVITYVNEATQKIMDENADALRALYPRFDPAKLVGACIDMFHANPQHQRRLLENPANLPYETDIHVGPLVFHIRVSTIHDLTGEYVGNTLEWSDVTELRQSEIDVARLQSAINGATANLMICDADLVITYANPAVVNMLAQRENVLRQRFPGFDARGLVGKNIDMFHKNPAHQRALLSDISRLPAKAEIKVADLEFEVNATAILDHKGNYMGNMVEWKDITEQKDAERQIQGLIDAASQGELDRRLDVSGYEGFMENLGLSINNLLEALVTPLRASADVVQALSKGDLTCFVEGDFQGEFALLRDAVNTSVKNLQDMVGKIRATTNNISQAASEISQGNADLSHRTEEQASSLEETASSMEEMTATVKQNADNAREANQLAINARDQAEKGGNVVGQAVTAMSDINSASKKIADIIGVIDEIAFQTNLLALNAAVEAARAGEQGRGFAVVASEVRNLAQRSAGAAKEIKTLIKDSVEKVAEGTKLVDMSGKSLEEIVVSVKKVSDIVAEITMASGEQSSGIEQVNRAVIQLDEVTQQNAALVEEAAAASESMDEQAQDLAELMTFFRTGTNDSSDQMNKPSSRAKMSPRQSMNSAAPKNRGARSASTQEEGEEWQEF